MTEIIQSTLKLETSNRREFGKAIDRYAKIKHLSCKLITDEITKETRKYS